MAYQSNIGVDYSNIYSLFFEQFFAISLNSAFIENPRIFDVISAIIFNRFALKNGSACEIMGSDNK